MSTSSSAAAIGREEEANKSLDIDERDKLHGRIAFKYAKFAEFANARDLSDWRWSDQRLCTRGLIWQMILKRERFTSLGIYVKCELENKYPARISWSCRAFVRLCLHSQNGGEDGNIVRMFSHNFHSGKSEQGFKEWISLEEILDPQKGWLDAKGALHVSAEITADEPQCVSYVSKPHVILVNGQEILVNKHHLATNSSYFDRHFFGEQSKEKENNIVIDPPASVDHFKRMIETMHPKNRPLDDGCIEGIFHLAKQFLLADVEGKCRYFLHRKSNHSAFFKYRLAEKYGFDVLKEHILKYSKKKLSEELEIAENGEEYVKLEEKARQELNSRLIRFFGYNKFDKESVKMDMEEPPSKRARDSD